MNEYLIVILSILTYKHNNMVEYNYVYYSNI